MSALPRFRWTPGSRLQPITQATRCGLLSVFLLVLGACLFFYHLNLLAAAVNLVPYSQSVVLPFQVILIALLLSSFAIGLQRGSISVGGSLRSLLAGAGTAVSVGGAFWAGNKAILITGLTVTVLAALYMWSRRMATADDLAAGTAFLWLLVSTAMVFLAPGASYRFQWPLLALLTVLAWRFVAMDPGGKAPPGLCNLREQQR